MKDINVEYLKEVIMNNESITEEDKERTVKALEVFTKYNTDLNKNADLRNLLVHAAEFLKHDGVNREDKLYADYKIKRDATREEIESTRDELLDKLNDEIENTKYLEQAKRLKEHARRVEKDFEHILNHLDKRVLSGDLNDKEVKKIKAKSIHELAELLESISEFTVDTKAKDEISDSSEKAFNYVYEGMSDEEIEEAKADLDSHPINYVKYGDNIHDYLEPIEYYPNTNVRKPRNIGPFESVEHYNAFLAEYYSKYDFSSVEATPVEETKNFYQSKLDYIKTRVQGYFNDIKDSLTTLRWLYNHALNEQDKDPEFKKFVNVYEEKLDSVNAIEGKMFNDKTLTGDIVLQIELDKTDDELDISISPLMALIDEENRKKFANYTINKDGSKVVDDDYIFNYNEITSEQLDMMVKDFVETVVEQFDDLDNETVMNSNIEVVYEGHSFVMPVKDFGKNAVRLMELGALSYEDEIKKDKGIARTKKLVNNNVQTLSKGDVESRLDNITSEEVELPQEKEETPEVSVTYPPYNEEDEKLTDMLNEVTDNKEENTLSEEERLDQMLDEAQTKMAEEVTEIYDQSQNDVEEIEVEEDKLTNEYAPEEVPEKVDIPDLVIEDVEPTTYVPTKSEEEERLDQLLEDAKTVKEPSIEPMPEMTPYEPVKSEEEERLDKLLDDVTNPKEETPQIINPFEATPLMIEDKQIKLNQQYKVVASRKPKYSKSTAALTVIGGALTIFGLAGASALSFGVGAAALANVVALNLDNLKRAARKFQLKRLAKRHDARVFFGRNDDIAMRNANGSKIIGDKIDEINEDLDNTFNKKIKSIVDKYTPMVTFDKLANLFILPGDTYTEEKTDSEYVSNYFENKAYEENVTNGVTKFESVPTEADIFYDDGITPTEEEVKQKPLSRLLKNIIPTQEEINKALYGEDEEVVEELQEEKEEVKEETPDYSDEVAELENLRRLKAEIDNPETIEKKTKSAIEQIMELNPTLDFKKDSEGYFVEVDDPNSIVCPEGFEYNGAGAITNRNSVGEYESEVIIGVFPKQELAPANPVEEIKEFYAELLDCPKEQLVKMQQMNSKYTLEQFEEAWDSYHQGTKTI
jgi:hypothetical protein